MLPCGEGVARAPGRVLMGRVSAGASSPHLAFLPSQVPSVRRLSCLQGELPQFRGAEASFSTASPVLGTEALQDTEDSRPPGQRSGVQLSGEDGV